MGLWTTLDAQLPLSATIRGMSWAQLASTQDGILTRKQLYECGLSEDGVDRLLRAGALVRTARGVFLVRGAPLTYRARLWRAVLSGDGALAFASAAHLWGITPDVPPTVHVVIAVGRRVRRPAGVTLHRCFVPASALTRRDGLPVTTLAWTVLDLLGSVSASRAQTLADRALQQGWITARDIAGRLDQLAGHSGNTRLRELSGQLGDGAAADSERLLHRILRRAGIRNWVANHAVWSNGALIAVVDVALVEERVAIEIDGWAFHSDVDRFQRDRTRQNALIAAGWVVLRFTWADLTQRPGRVATLIGDQLTRSRDYGALAPP
jgi:very-short-patch-repair endonuclease